MSTLYDTIRAEVEAFIAVTKAEFSDGIGPGDILSVVNRGARGIVKIMQATGADNEAKKTAAMQAFTEFYNSIEPLINFPGVDVFVKPFFRWIIMMCASSLIDGMVDLVFHPER